MRPKTSNITAAMTACLFTLGSLLSSAEFMSLSVSFVNYSIRKGGCLSTSNRPKTNDIRAVNPVKPEFYNLKLCQFFNLGTW